MSPMGGIKIFSFGSWRGDWSGLGTAEGSSYLAPLVFRIGESDVFQFGRVGGVVNGSPAAQETAHLLRSASRLDGDHQMVSRAGVGPALDDHSSVGEGRGEVGGYEGRLLKLSRRFLRWFRVEFFCVKDLGIG